MKDEPPWCSARRDVRGIPPDAYDRVYGVEERGDEAADDSFSELALQGIGNEGSAFKEGLRRDWGQCAFVTQSHWVVGEPW
jgi:hypothetical protein